MPRRRTPQHVDPVLLELRRQLTATARERGTRPQALPDKAARRTVVPAPAAEDAATLLRLNLGPIEPLRHAPRADIAHPKPAPLPRRHSTADLEPAPSLARSNDAQVTPESANLGATPLSQSRRANLQTWGSTPLPAKPTVEPLSGFEVDPPLPWLPPTADTLDGTALFALALRGTRALDSGHKVVLDTPPPLPEPRQRVQDERAALHETLHAPVSLEDRLETGEEAAFLRPGVPRRVLTDLRRGRWIRQAELDLHGLNRDAARSALVAFLNTCLRRGHRCVRIIHGKGLGSPGRESILRQLSRGWLAQRNEILAFCQASPHHGGSGALMVLIRSPNLRQGDRT